MDIVKNAELDKKLMLLINPVAGRMQYKRYLTEIVSLYMERGYAVTLYFTRRRGDAAYLASKYGGGYDAVVCAGGDGTLSETLGGIVSGGYPTPVGYIPEGSSNDFAHIHHISTDLMTAARDAVDGKVRRVDIGSFGGRMFIYIAAFGAFSWLSYSTPQGLKNAIGHSAYVFDGMRDLPKIKAEKMKVEADGRAYEGNFIFGAVCNTTTISGVLNLPKKEVVTDDGLFEVLLVRAPESLAEWQSILGAVSSGQYNTPLVDFFHTGRLTVTSDNAVDWSLDGEYAPGAPSVEIRNLPRAAGVVVPG